MMLTCAGLNGATELRDERMKWPDVLPRQPRPKIDRSAVTGRFSLRVELPPGSDFNFIGVARILVRAGLDFQQTIEGLYILKERGEVTLDTASVTMDLVEKLQASGLRATLHDLSDRTGSSQEP